jgi:AcrR family transcriptional regulator
MGRPVTKKRDIEIAAIKLFARQGLASTTLKDIAAEAGATEGALYRHYKSKNEMARQLFCQELKAFTDLLLPRLQADSPFGDRLADAVRLIYGYYRRQPDVFSFILLSQHNFPDQDLLCGQTNPYDMAADFLDRGMKEGAIPAGDPVLLTGLVMGAILQPLVMHSYGRLVLNDELVDTVIAACQRLVGAKA